MADGDTDAILEAFETHASSHLCAVARSAFLNTNLVLDESPESLANKAFAICLIRFGVLLSETILPSVTEVKDFQRTAIAYARQALRRDFLDACKRARTRLKYEHVEQGTMAFSQYVPSPDALMDAAAFANEVLGVCASDTYRRIAQAIIDLAPSGPPSNDDVAERAGVKPAAVSEFRKMAKKKLPERYDAYRRTGARRRTYKDEGGGA